MSTETIAIVLMAIMVIGVIFVFISIASHDSKKETKRERMAETAGNMAVEAATGFSNLVKNMAEPEDKKKIRLARHALAERNRSLYEFTDYSDKDYRNRLFAIDDEFKNALDTLGLSETQWKRLASYMFFIGPIDRFSYYSYDKNKKNTESNRLYIMQEGDKDDVEALKEALSYFHIKEEDWIKYGDAVIGMYDLENTTADLNDYRII